ncbi:MAG TPA: hypothetical protein VJ717_17220, partial [Gemmatimonadaceae bacterium]|nr:hypothetical protein [Gemmatimonadaceae bacterium]
MFVAAYPLGVLCVLLTQLLVAAAFVGIGLLVRRAFGLTKVSLDDCFTAFWIGFGVVILALMLWHFVLPVNAAALALVMLVGALGVFLSRDVLRSVLDDEKWLSSRAWRAAFALAALYVANQGLGSLTYSDT